MNNTVYLEVDRSNKAILSYFLELPSADSNEVEYVQATMTELTYLNGLEAGVLPLGTVTTLEDLQAFRARLQATQKAKPTVITTAAPAAPQQPAKTTQGAKKADLSQKVAKFKNGFKPVQTPTKGN